MSSDYEEDDDVAEETKLPCPKIRADLLECIHQSSCFLNEGKTVKQCLQKSEAGAAECQDLSYAYFACRRSIMDMRTRFRGRKGH